jgi:type I restriction enzyme S subunit
MAAVEEETGRLDASTARPFGDLRGKSYRYFKEGDVIFAKITPCMENGKIALARGLHGARAFGSTEFHIFRPSEGIDGRYILHYLLQKSFRNEARRHMTGTAGQLRVPAKFLEGVEIPLPPAPEQHRIVAAIDEQLSRIDAGVKALQRARRNIERMEEAVLQGAVEGKLVPQDPKDEPAEALLKRILKERQAYSGRSSMSKEPRDPEDVGNLPTGWASATLNQLARLITKGTTPTSLGRPFTTEGVLFIKAESLVDGVVDHERCAHISEETHQLLKRSQLVEDDVVVTIAGTLGRAALVRPVDIPANTNQAVSLIRLVDTSLARYLLVWLQSPSGRGILTQTKRGVGLQNISLQDVREAVVPIPPLGEQRRIVDEVLRWTSLLEDLHSMVAACQQRAVRLRQAILRNAFTGRLVPQMLYDEPAPALLERIRSNHAAKDSPGRAPQRLRR